MTPPPLFMKPLYRFYLNLFWASGLAGVIYALYHFFGPAAMILLIFIIPVAIIVLVAMNCAASEMDKEER